MIYFEIKVNDKIKFTIPGEPVAKGRARFARRGNFVTTYTPEKTARYENLVKLAAQKAMAVAVEAPIECAVGLIICAYFSVPRSWSLKRQSAAESGEVMHTKRPDLDNVIKSIKDGANCVVWNDDSQVVDIRASKRYGTPRVEVEVFKIK